MPNFQEELAAFPMMPESEIYIFEGHTYVGYVPTAMLEWACNDDRDILIKSKRMIGREHVYVTGGNFEGVVAMFDYLGERTPWKDGGYNFAETARRARTDIRIRNESDARYAAIATGRVAA